MQKIKQGSFLLVVLLSITLVMGLLPLTSSEAHAAGKGADVAAVAKAEKDGKPVGGQKNKYTGFRYEEWCAYFVIWCARQAGVPASVIPAEPYVPALASFYKKKGLWHGTKYTPKAGDLIFYSQGGSFPCYVGIVTSVSGGYVYTKEGNTTGGKVKTIKRKVGTSYIASNWQIIGYASPKYGPVMPSISSATVSGIKEAYTYNGTAIKPTVTLQLNGKTLRSGKDYTVFYLNNNKNGVATVTIKGAGDYTGTLKKTFKINSWKTINGKRYYFDSDNKPVKWTQYIDGKRYYFDGNGVMQTGWITWKDDGTKSYFGKDGAAVKWTQYINGKRYYFDENYIMQTGWITWSKDKTKSYFGADGAALKWSQIIDGNRYYFDGSGIMQTGWVTWKDDSTRSYFGQDGIALTGWQTIAGKKYYFDSENKDRTLRWTQYIDGNRYYFKGDGSMHTGLLTWKDTGLKSFFNEEGIMDSGWHTVSGKTYYFNPETNMSVKWTQYIDGNRYYFNSDGSMHKGWITWKDSGKKSYFGSDGAMVYGWKTINGKSYYFDRDGHPVKWTQYIDGERYYFNSDGSMHTGWLTWNKTQTKSYFNHDGVMVYGEQVIDGTTYLFDEEGVLENVVLEKPEANIQQSA